MRIIDLIPEYEPTFFACLKDWDQESVVGDHKRRWYAEMKDRGLRVKVDRMGYDVLVWKPC
jgi:hypothetical protein